MLKSPTATPMPYISTSRPGRAGHIGERAIAIVAVKVHGAALLHMAGPVHAVDQQDILPAIVVVVQKRATRPQRFRQVLLPKRAAVVMEVYACGGGDVGKMETGVDRAAGL